MRVRVVRAGMENLTMFNEAPLRGAYTRASFTWACALLLNTMILAPAKAADPGVRDPDSTGMASGDLALETLLVTASRMAVTPVETASSVTVITREEIERSQALYLTDLLRDVPGVALAQSGGVGTQAQIRIRGAEANQVLVMIDGVEANDPGGADEAGLQNLMLADVERVEIVRGPQSALWGSDAMAGVIHIITRAGTDGRVSGRLNGGSFGTQELALSGSVGLGAGSAAAEDAASAGGRPRGRIGGSLVRYRTDGVNISRTGSEADGFENTLASVRGTLELLPTLEVFAQARTQRQTLDTDTLDFASGLPVDANNQTDSTQDYFAVGVAGAFFDEQWRPSLRLTRFASDATDFTGGALDGWVKASRNGLYFLSEIAPAALPSHRATVGIDHEYAEFSQVNTGSFFGIPVTQDAALRGTGYTFEYRYVDPAGWGVTGSARHDTSSAFSSATTYRVGGWLQASPSLRLRVAHGTARKNPTFTERFGFYPNNPFVRFIGNPTLTPERSKGTEIGLEHALGALPGSLSLTLFRERLTDEIRDVFDFSVFPGLASTVNSAGESRRYGAEFAADVRTSAWMQLRASYTWLRSLQPGLTPEGGDAGTLFDELRRPRHQGSLTLVLDPAKDWSGRVNLSLVGDRPDTDFGTGQTVTLQAYSLLEASMAYTPMPSVKLGLRGTNLTNSAYEDVFGYNTPGRAVYGTLEVQLP